uniref:Uncharacterized protein n=1 Tax=Setaria digitata TaxID=48799 RepID=A0A915PX40_9BILA
MNIRICVIGVLAVGAIFIILGILSLTVIPLTMSKQINKNEHLGLDENGTYNIMTQRWIEPKYSMRLKVWTVSVENPEDVAKLGSYPALIEKGPYVFIEHQKKIKVDFMRNNTRVLYRNKRYYIYDENESCTNCSLNDLVTIPNILLQYLVNIAKSPFIAKFLELVLLQFKRETPFIRVRVGEMLFDGYEDPIIERICSGSLRESLCAAANIPMRIKFLENDTDDGEYLIDSGLENIDRIGRVYAWNGRNETPWWSTAQARKINGTNGDLFPPLSSVSSDLPVFFGQLGR